MKIRLLGAIAAIGIGAVASSAPVPAQAPLELFDAHLHYNQEPNPFYPLDKVLEIFKRNGVTGILATSRPNKGTHQLVDAKAPGLWVVPFIRPYRTRADTTIVKKIVDFAVERNLFLHAHCDETALLILFQHNPKARVIWAHTGFSTPPARVRELMEKYSELWGELSYRSGLTDAGGSLTKEWRDLFASHSSRFLIGSDTWINERWFSYDAIFREYRNWLAQLPQDQAKRIASGNAERLFGPRRAE